MAEWHEIKQGESIIRLGDVFGFSPETIWSHANNAALRNIRKDMNELLPGDRVFIPDRRDTTREAGTDQRHIFRRKGVPARCRIQVLYHGKPVPNAKYALAVEDNVMEGATDGAGVVSAIVPPRAEYGLLWVEPADKTIPALVIDVKLGHLDPMNSRAGLRKRLRNLGFWMDEEKPTQQFTLAVRRFQKAYGLPPSGFLDPQTKAALETLHDTAETIQAMKIPAKGSQR